MHHVAIAKKSARVVGQVASGFATLEGLPVAYRHWLDGAEAAERARRAALGEDTPAAAPVVEQVKEEVKQEVKKRAKVEMRQSAGLQWLNNFPVLN